MNSGYNPDFNPTGIEGGLDTNALPWIELPQVPGLAFKPLRASDESGMFTLIMRLRQNAQLNQAVYLGGMDLMLLSGAMQYPDGPMQGTLTPGIWGYAPANTRVTSLQALEDTEFLVNFYGPLALLDADGRSVLSLLTALDVAQAAAREGIALVPNSLADCMQPRVAQYSGAAMPLAMAQGNAGSLVGETNASGEPIMDVGRAVQPHFVDTRAVPWIVNPGLPDIALKVLRVSEETGIVSLIVRHNGVAGPHYHLGAADFLVLSGHIGYRAGPPEGYGPGVWFYEPAGARHEATQRVGTDDLIYTANVYGPVQFDEGPDTPIVAVQSWMQYKALADASGIELVRSRFDGDSTLLAWSPIGSAAQTN